MERDEMRKNEKGWDRAIKNETTRERTRRDRTKQKRVLTRERTRTFEGRRQIENAVNKRGRDETRKKQQERDEAIKNETQ